MSEFLARLEQFCNEKDVWNKWGVFGMWLMHILFDKPQKAHFRIYRSTFWGKLNSGHVIMYGIESAPWTRHNQIYYTVWQEDEF